MSARSHRRGNLADEFKFHSDTLIINVMSQYDNAILSRFVFFYALKNAEFLLLYFFSNKIESFIFPIGLKYFSIN